MGLIHVYIFLVICGSITLVLTVRVLCLDGVPGPDGQGLSLLVDGVDLELVEVPRPQALDRRIRPRRLEEREKQCHKISKVKSCFRKNKLTSTELCRSNIIEQ